MLNFKVIISNYIKKPNIIKFLNKFLKVHITPVNYYSPIPDINELSPDIFTKVNDCMGLSFDADSLQCFMENDCNKYLEEYFPVENSGLSKVDAFVLYVLIRERKPIKFVEIGSGESTKIALKALEKNKLDGDFYSMTAIEPYPREYLKTIENSSFLLIEKKVQDVAISVFDNTDILFIDSSHVSKIGSDVNFEIFQVLPRMKVGSLIHWHDIMIPIDYPKSWIENGNMYWNESYMVQSFMMFNTSFKIYWPSKYMQVKFPQELKQHFPFFQPGNPSEQLSSFWIERIA
jgi:hypothetical protein